MQKIYCVEDDESVRELVIYALQSSGFEAQGFVNAEEFFPVLKNNVPDLILLDIMLPGIDGIEILKEVRKNPKTQHTPIIMLTAKDEINDKVTGLDIGADDYMTKPFAIQELLARVRNVLRKHRADNEDIDGEKLQVKDLIMYPTRYEVTVQGEEVQLTKKEYALLEYLLRNKRNVLTRDQILQEVWGYDYTGDTNVVDVYIRYLRAKIDDHFNAKYIYTVRGVGYAIKE